jgi:hypothetical protein
MIINTQLLDDKRFPIVELFRAAKVIKGGYIPPRRVHLEST